MDLLVIYSSKVFQIETFGSFDKKMDFYLITGASTFLCFQVTWRVTMTCPDNFVLFVLTKKPSCTKLTDTQTFDILPKMFLYPC